MVKQPGSLIMSVDAIVARMKWTSSAEALPEHEEEVLIRTGEHYALSVYDANKGAFVIKKDERLAKVDQLIVFWMRLVPPQQDRILNKH